MNIGPTSDPTGELAASRFANQTSVTVARKALDVTKQQGEAAVEMIRAVGRTQEALNGGTTPGAGPSTRPGSLDVMA
jgi:hypothetical protein